MVRTLLALSLLLPAFVPAGCDEDAKYPSCRSDDECDYQQDEVCRHNQCVKGEPKKIPPFSGTERSRRLGRRGAGTATH